MRLLFLHYVTFLSSILIHASARDATAKSYKIGNNFAVLFRKFIQKLSIVIFRISIFLEKQEQYFYFCSANLPEFLRCFRFAPTFLYIVCQNLRLVDFSVEVLLFQTARDNHRSIHPQATRVDCGFLHGFDKFLETMTIVYVSFSSIIVSVIVLIHSRYPLRRG